MLHAPNKEKKKRKKCSRADAIRSWNFGYGDDLFAKEKKKKK
jgi:hypothetical protein